MLAYVIRKILNNRMMSGFLLLGMILAIAIVSTIPMYTSGILQKVLLEELEGVQEEQGIYPGYYQVKADFSRFDKSLKVQYYKNLKKNVIEKLIPELDLPLLSLSEEIFIDYYSAVPAEQREENPKSRLISLYSREDIESHITLIHGELYSNNEDRDTIEVIVPEGFLRDMDLLLNEILIEEKMGGSPLKKLKVVGVFRVSDPQDPYWRSTDLANRVYISSKIYQEKILNRNNPQIRTSTWDIALDYHELKIRDLPYFISVLVNHQTMADQYSSSIKIDFAGGSILSDFLFRARQLRITLLMIEIPVLVLLLFYILLITDLIFSGEQNEISVLKSRGKSKGQIFQAYLLQIGILGIIALAAGPPLGYIICKWMGASNGFLEFVRRAPLQVSITPQVFLYSGVTLLVLLLIMIIPIFSASKKSIVEVKQQKARDLSDPLWKKAFIDVVLLLLSGYGYYRYFSQKSMLNIARVSGAEMGMDPILFLTSSLFILGAGLLFIRLFPLLIKGIYKLGITHWSPEMYYALLQVGRTGKRGQFLMLFLLFSIAMGIFDANMARTLNKNTEDRVRYMNGADITLQQEWEKESSGSSVSTTDFTSGSSDSTAELIHYKEPSFTPFSELEGVETATPVFLADDGKVESEGNVIHNIQIQGIEPRDFGRVSWFRSDLLDYHWFHYLNLLSEGQNVFLVSSNLQQQMNLKPGDRISIALGGQEYSPGVFYAAVDYWPGYSPLDEEGKPQYLVVSNLSYLHNRFAKLPYQVWLKKSENTPDSLVYDSLVNKEIDLLSLNSTSQELIRKKNDPLLKGINGALTQGFMMIILVCIIGYLIYWVISLKSRTLQFGILRAIGLSKASLAKIILLEQLMISVLSIFMGVFIGGLASYLFVPFLQLIFSAAEQIPPFLVQALRSDYLKIYAIILFMLGLGAAILFYTIGRLKIGSALKLGED